MTVAYLGSLSIGALVPGALNAQLAGVAGIDLALPDIEARLEALLAFSPGPIDFGVQLTLAAQMLASVQAAIALGITPPSLSVQIALIAALVVELQAAILDINAELDILVTIGGLLATAGVHGYTYSGDADQLGLEFTSELSGGFPGGSPTDSTNAILLATTVGATWTAMQSIFRTTP